MALAYVLLIKYLLILGHVMWVSFLNVNHFAHLNRKNLIREADHCRFLVPGNTQKILTEI